MLKENAERRLKVLASKAVRSTYSTTYISVYVRTWLLVDSVAQRRVAKGRKTGKFGLDGAMLLHMYRDNYVPVGWFDTVVTAC